MGLGWDSGWLRKEPQVSSASSGAPGTTKKGPALGDVARYVTAAPAMDIPQITKPWVTVDVQSRKPVRWYTRAL